MKKSFASLVGSLPTNEAFEVKDREDESLSQAGVLGATEAAVKLAETTAEVADGNTKVLEDLKEIDALETGIEEALDGVGEIRKLLKAAEDVTDEGGMTKSMAKLIQTTHENITSRLAMQPSTKHTKDPVPSLESFGTSSIRMRSHLATMEALKDNIKAIIAKVMEVLRNGWQKVEGLVANLTNNAAVMERHIDNLSKAVAAIPNDAKPQSSTLDAHGSPIRVGGRADARSAMAILESAKKLVAIIPESAAALQEDAKSFKGKGDGTRAMADMLTKAGKSLGTGNATGVYGHFANGTSMKIDTDGTLNVEFVETAKPVQAAAAPTPAEMKQLLVKAKEVAVMLKGAQQPLRTVKNSVDSVMATLKSIGPGQDEEEKARLNAAKEVARFVTKVGSAYPSQVAKSLKVVVGYVSAGVKNMQAPKAEAKPAAGETKPA